MVLRGLLIFVANLVTTKPSGATRVLFSGQPNTLLNLFLEAVVSGAGKLSDSLVVVTVVSEPCGPDFEFNWQLASKATENMEA